MSATDLVLQVIWKMLLKSFGSKVPGSIWNTSGNGPGHTVPRSCSADSSRRPPANPETVLILVQPGLVLLVGEAHWVYKLKQ